MSGRLLCFIFSSSLALAGSWEDHVQARRKGDLAQGTWTLCLGHHVLSPSELSDDLAYQRLSTAGDWRLELLNSAQAQDLHETLGARWALLAPGGAVAGVGPGKPRGADLLDAIHASGAKSRFELREAFLKDHPDQGEARQEALGQDLRMLRARVSSLREQGRAKLPNPQGEGGFPAFLARVSLAGAEGDGLAEELHGRVLEALDQLARVPHWTREAQWLASRLAQFDLGQSAAGRKRFQELVSEVEARAAAEPQDVNLLQLWLEILDSAAQPPEGLSGRIAAVPGTLWPPAQALPSLLEPHLRRRDWAGVERLLADLAPQGPPEPLTPKGWEDYCTLQGALLAQSAALLASRGTPGEARSTLEEALHWGGPQVVQSALLRRGLLDAHGEATALRGLLARAAAHAQPRPPMPPQPPALRLTLLGRPSWLLAWTALRDAPDLALWSPAELRWDIATPEVHAHARRRFHWDAQPRWVLFRGEEPLVSGEACPDPRALAGILAAHGTPMAERLASTLSRYPGLAAARRARFELLQARMPDPRLEPLLAEDAARLGLALPFGPEAPWMPDEDLWGAAAQGVLPALEAELRSWPSAPALWEAWLSWARFHPGHPSVVDLARSLPFWCPTGDFRAGLPYQVQRAVAAELRRQGDFMLMREWFQGAWDQLDHRPMKELRPWERQWLAERRKEEETAVFQPLSDAYRGLGMTEQQLDLERAFGAMMGRETARSR